MDSAIHLALSHPHEVLEGAINMLKECRQMGRQEAIEYIATNHAKCKHGRECPWVGWKSPGVPVFLGAPNATPLPPKNSGTK